MKRRLLIKFIFLTASSLNQYRNVVEQGESSDSERDSDSSSEEESDDSSSGSSDEEEDHSVAPSSDEESSCSSEEDTPTFLSEEQRAQQKTVKKDKPQHLYLEKGKYVSGAVIQTYEINFSNSCEFFFRVWLN